MQKETPSEIFALDIGTRKVMGLMAHITPVAGQNLEIEILDAEIREHPTRSMSAGQIEDVRAVAETTAQVVDSLSQRLGKRPQEVAIAVAGRNLKTAKGKFVVNCRPDGSPFGKHEIDEATWKALEEALSKFSPKEEDVRPQYSCVGYVVSKTSIDGEIIQNPLGHYGQELEVEVLASFLPYRILESQIDVLESLGLSVSSITLEPIAALQAVVSRDLRRLNLALIDVGAGTSDIAFVSQGVIQSFGMVPQAGDSITEKIADSFLLDFLHAEDIKRNFSIEMKRRDEYSDNVLSPSRVQTIDSSDIFGRNVSIPIKDIQTVINLALIEFTARIAGAILEASYGKAPQAVLCVGGGSLLPGFTQMLAEALEISPLKVGVSRPLCEHYIQKQKSNSWGPETATPLGTLEIAAANRGLRFKKVFVNGRRTFVLTLGNKHPTIFSALVAAGIPPKKIFGWPGPSKTFTLNGKFRIFKPHNNPLPEITLNQRAVSIEEPINELYSISFKTPTKNQFMDGTVGEAIGFSRTTVLVNGVMREIPLRVFSDGIPISLNTPIKDRMRLTTLRVPLGDILTPAEKTQGGWRVNGELASLNRVVQDGDKITLTPIPPLAHLSTGKVLPSSTLSTPNEPSNTKIHGNYFTIPLETPALNKASKTPLNPGTPELQKIVPAMNQKINIWVNGQAISLDNTPSHAPLLADALRFVEIDTSSASGKKLHILLNGQQAFFTSSLQDGSKIEVFFE